ncbi:hypothetical protein ACFTZB_22315 [Rhodococcus sp. NPDC057014]|uniref:hypothetical protein n=1 Tax=Rhodococcus sp. NPDC057014 TaxID=3346000 RepID=UPI003628CA23
MPALDTEPVHLRGDPESRDGDEPLSVGHRVTVDDDFTGVIKVAHLLRHPACEIVDFAAHHHPSGWIVEYVCSGTSHQLQMLRKRVYRLPEVTKIECRPR